MKKQEFEMTDRMTEFFDSIDTDYDYIDLIANLEKVYALLPFENIEQFENWLSDSKYSQYDFESVSNLLNSAKPLSDYTITNYAFDNDFCNENLIDADLAQDRYCSFSRLDKMCFIDLCFLNEWYMGFVDSLKNENLKSELQIESSMIYGLIVAILDNENSVSDTINNAVFNDFSQSLIDSSLFYHKNTKGIYEK